MPSTPPILLKLDFDTVAYVVHALRRQAALHARNGMATPQEIVGLVELLASSASEGQRGPAPAHSASTGQVEQVQPRLVTYETAADLLACSVRQIKRLVGKALPVIEVGGLRRIHVNDIDRFIENQRANRPPEGGKSP